MPDDREPRIDPRFASYRLIVRPSRIHRFGLFAAEDIPARRKVIEYAGERIGREETIRRLGDQAKLMYLFTLDKKDWSVTIDGSVGGSGAEYINHSCDPNIRAWVFKGHLLYMARRAIREGDELTIDYKFPKASMAVPCFCGSAQCRGEINLK
ncbi:Proteins containing SET domain [Granulicella sibirica]|uniref:Proteins containing SET domain n=2 Tax=Granulicella sibirica TaxID=2479048 RepID=A0A4Q0STK1_9BACT|nr:Proteins containing SET domain [Granulicella sibirica]